MISLIKGDCLDIMDSFPSGYFDAIICDPPYGTTACKWDSVIDLSLMWKQLKRIIKPNGAIVLFGSQPFTSVLITSNLKMFKYDLVWDKKRPTGQLNAKKQPLRQHENILVFYTKPPCYNPIMHENRLKRKFKGNVNKDRKTSDTFGQQYDYEQNINANSKSYPRSIIEQTAVIGTSKEKVKHPTQKPIALMEYLIKTYTNEGEKILDFTVGSGTTGLAAVNLKREFVGIEKDPEYFKLAQDRINSACLLS